MTVIDWADGGILGLEIPAHSEALKNGGIDFLNQAFHSAGTLASDNRITQITQCEECPGGSTGRKLLLSVIYENPASELHTALFVKFSRDFEDPIRDQAKFQLEPEVRLALLSRNPGFPIAVPKCYFADYHEASGTGILITQRIPFGQNGNEPLYEKCMDYKLPNPLEHYQTIIKALAKLAGPQKSGELSTDIDKHFPFDISKQAISQPLRYNLEQLQRRIEKFSNFATHYPQLLPNNITTQVFIERMEADLPVLLDQQQTIKHYLHSKPEYFSLIHWNANIDNAWFWRDKEGTLQCGLMDWGMVSHMNIGQALWGALSAAELELWDHHLDELLAFFITELQNAGGPALDIDVLKLHMCLSVTILGLSWLMDAPALIEREISDLNSVENRFDQRFKASETARTQLQMLINFLTIWQGLDLDAALKKVSNTI